VEDDRDLLDRILDQGISTYGNGEPLAGLETRILARLESTKRQSPWTNVLQAIAITTSVASMILFLSVILFHRVQPSSTEVSPRHVSQRTPILLPQTNSTIREVSSLPAHPNVRLRRARASSPKRKSFPTPQPLTSGEHALLAFAADHPDETARALVGSREQLDQPLEIAPIVILPLATETEKEP